MRNQNLEKELTKENGNLRRWSSKRTFGKSYLIIFSVLGIILLVSSVTVIVISGKAKSTDSSDHKVSDSNLVHQSPPPSFRSTTPPQSSNDGTVIIDLSRKETLIPTPYPTPVTLAKYPDTVDNKNGQNHTLIKEESENDLLACPKADSVCPALNSPTTCTLSDTGITCEYSNPCFASSAGFLPDQCRSNPNDAESDISPNRFPTEGAAPSKAPTKAPTKDPTNSPTNEPTHVHAKYPTKTPTERPTDSMINLNECVINAKLSIPVQNLDVLGSHEDMMEVTMDGNENDACSYYGSTVWCDHSGAAVYTNLIDYKEKSDETVVIRYPAEPHEFLIKVKHYFGDNESYYNYEQTNDQEWIASISINTVGFDGSTQDFGPYTRIPSGEDTHDMTGYYINEEYNHDFYVTMDCDGNCVCDTRMVWYYYYDDDLEFYVPIYYN